MMNTLTMTPTMKTLGLHGMGLLTLLLPLAAQEQGKTSRESGDRAAQEYRQTLKATAVAQEVQEVQKQDSLRRLIHDLDTGSTSVRSSAASKANGSLRSLGSLMVPALLAELDDLGPFGLMNASKLLTSYPDESLGALVERYLKDPSPARQEMAAGLLRRLGSETRRKLYPLALASKRDNVRLAGIYAMSGLGIEEEGVLKEIERVYKEGRGPTRTSLVSVIGERKLEKSTRGGKLLRSAMEDPDGSVRAKALWVFLEPLDDENEDQVLALFQTLGEGDRESFLDSVLEMDTRWPRLLMAALDYPDLRTRVRRKLDELGVRLSPEQISSMLGSKDKGLLGFALQRLSVRRELVPKMEPLLGLLDHPDYQIRQKAMMLLVESGDRILLESGRFEDLSRLGRSLSDQVKILERASGGHWVKEMFSVWKMAEQYEVMNPGSSMGNVKSRISALLVRNLGVGDWPLLEKFLRTGSTDPKIDLKPREGYMNRQGLLVTLIVSGYLNRELQIKALRLTPDTTEAIAIEIFNQISEDLIPGQARPELEAVLFEVLAGPAGKDGVIQQAARRHAYLRGELVDSCLQLLGELPSSKRDADLLALVKSSNYELATGASEALLARSKDRVHIFEAMLATPHASRLILGVLDQPELAKVSQLRKAVIEKLQGGLLLRLDMRYKPAGEKLETFLYNLDRKERSQLLAGLLGKLPQGLDGRVTALLLERLGDDKDELHLEVFAPFLEDRSGLVRRAAVEAIGRTFSPKAAPYLLEALKDEETSALARHYLQKIDEYLQEQAKWQKRFSGLESMGSGPSKPGPAGPGKSKK